MQRLKVAFDAVPLARWGPLFHVLLMEQPNLSVDWQPVGFPTVDRSLLDGVDVGLFVQPPAEPGLDSLVIETSQLAVLMAAGHRLGYTSELSIAHVLDEAFPGSPNTHPEWRAFGPARGEHTEQVLAELCGYTTEMTAELRAGGVFGEFEA